MMMQLKLISVMPVAAMLAVLASTTDASAQSSMGGAGYHGSAPLRGGHGSSLPGRTFRSTAVGRREKRPRFKSALVAGVYPWNDPAWRYRLYGAPCPYLYYRPIYGYELMPYSVGKKLRWRRVFRCQ